MAVGGVVREGHARKRNGLAAAKPLAPAPCTNTAMTCILAL
jgi:hypothetical protein